LAAAHITKTKNDKAAYEDIIWALITCLAAAERRKDRPVAYERATLPVRFRSRGGEALLVRARCTAIAGSGR
jgi:hypothetical protein